MDKLKHAEISLPKGGFVFVLDTGALIDSQAEAMLQALHSRSTGGIKSHLKVLEEKGAQNFMEKFYVGYGHKSIGDCGSATVFVEGISMLAAKAIQDWRLYSGQEASTRYIDFSEQAFINPLGTKKGTELLEGYREYYLACQEPVKEHLRKQFPLGEGEKEKTYEKAIAARAFDITRGLLPAGASTNVAWRMNLRQFADELMMLRHHPLEEVRDIAETTEQALIEIYPQSFGHKRYEGTEGYNKTAMTEYYFEQPGAPNFEVPFDGVNTELLSQYKHLLESRPAKTELPPAVAETGVITYNFLLDFGSFRDLQRHRAVVQRMPLLTTEHGFESWYIDAMPESLREKTKSFLSSQQEKISSLNTTKEIAQYYTAMGYNVPCRLTGDLRAVVYLAELRSTRFVHPTLVTKAIMMIEDLKQRFSSYGLVLHHDNEPNRFDIKRGEHDITMKDE